MPLTAIFAVDRSRFSQPMIEGWLAAGNRVAAIVTTADPRRIRSGTAALLRRVSTLLSFRQRLERRGIPFIEIGHPSDWPGLVPRLLSMRADVLICFAFPKKIPDDVLALFPLGGLNLHPALLPRYRGPHPIHRMLIDGAQHLHGGVTLHRMTGEFDAGDILARIRFGDEDWASLGAFRNALAGATEQLAVEIVPLVASGALRGHPQAAEDASWASVGPEPLVVSPDWTSEYLGRIGMFLGAQPGVAVEIDGRLVRLAPPPMTIGPATGAPATTGRRTVSFDLADGRVRCRIRTKSTRRLARLRARLDRLRQPARRRTIVYAGET